MAYYCPFCGEEAYKGHREYKCGNEDCEEHSNPIFGRNRQLHRKRYASKSNEQTAN
jgi:hypothetical protein